MEYGQISVYQVRLQRATRRWRLDERFSDKHLRLGRWLPAGTGAVGIWQPLKSQPSTPPSPSFQAFADAIMHFRRLWDRPFNEKNLRFGRWSPADTGAVPMKEPLKSERSRLPLPTAEAFADAIRHGPGSRLLLQAFTEQVRWLPPALDHGALILSWVIPLEDWFAPALLSASFGLFSRRLRLCRHCEAPFVADHPWERRCRECARRDALVAKRLHNLVVKRVLDRLRKRSSGTLLAREARHDLQGLSEAEWLAKWGTRSPRGPSPGYRDRYIKRQREATLR